MEEVKEKTNVATSEPKTLDHLEKEIRAMKIEEVDFQMKNLQFTILQLLGFCRKQQKANEELTFMALKGAKDSMEYVLKSGNNAMKDVMKGMKAVLTDGMTSDLLIQLARGVVWNLSYSNSTKSIYIEVATVECEEEGQKYNEKYYLTLKCILKENGKELYQLDIEQDTPECIAEDYGFPLFFDTVDQVIGYLNRDGLVLSIGASVKTALKSKDEDQRNDLAASAIFSTE